jgi:predicted DNA-binding protein YlxM (UPF0122 family)
MSTKLKEERKVISGKTILLKKGKKKNIKDNSLSTEQIRDIIWDYTYNLKEKEELAEEHNVTVGAIHSAIRQFKTDFLNYTETRELMDSQKLDMGVTSTTFKLPKGKGSTSVNEEFLKLLSHSQDKTLTEEEMTYCWIYTHTNNHIKALKDS